MEAVAHLHVLNELRQLKGRAKVSYPYGDVGFPVVERVVQVARGEGVDGWKLDFHTPDEDFPLCKLVQQSKLAEGTNYVEVYRRYERLPGHGLVSKSEGVPNLIPDKFRSKVQTITTSTPVAPGTNPDAPSGNLIQSQVVHEVGGEIAQKVNVEEIVSVNTNPLVSPSLEDQEYVTIETLVDEGAEPDCGTGVVESNVTALGNGKAVKTTKIAVTSYTNPNTFTAGFQSLVNETEGDINVIPAKFRASGISKIWKFQVNKDALVAGVDYPALGVGSGAYAGYSIVEVARKQARKVTGCGLWEVAVVGIVINTNPLAGQQTGSWGVESTEEKLVAEGTAAQTGFGIKESRVVPLGNGRAVSEKSTWDTSTVLRETVVDDQTGLVIEVEKKLVPAGTVGSFSSGQVVEVQPIDKWHSVQITSKLASGGLPSSESLSRSVRYAFDDELLALNLVHAGGLMGNQTVITGGIGAIFGAWVDTVAGILPVIRHGPNGTFDGRVVRTYSLGVPMPTKGVWAAFPESVSALCVYEAYGLDGAGKTGSRETSVSIGPTLHKALTVTLLSGVLKAYFTTNTGGHSVTATNPSKLPASGTEVLISSNIEKWRLGIYVKEDTYITMPTPQEPSPQWPVINASL